MAWYISKDVIGEGMEEGLFVSNWRDGINTLERCQTACKKKFRLKDDDGEVYYYGYANDSDSESAFDPLDWAMANAGCTSIEYYENGKWEYL